MININKYTCWRTPGGWDGGGGGGGMGMNSFLFQNNYTAQRVSFTYFKVAIKTSFFSSGFRSTSPYNNNFTDVIPSIP